MVRINFQPYTIVQLMEIVKARLDSVNEGKEREAVIRDDAIRMAASKVAAVTGDARRVLDTCR
jgi:origin recognition complex subunit 1